MGVEIRLCACNCGEYAKPGNRYIKGHSRKGTGKPKSPSQLCACGICGLMTKPGCKFINGHGRKGKHFTDEQLVNCKIAQNRPEVKANHSEKTRINWQNPEIREKTISAQIESQNKPEVKAKYAEANAKPEVKKRRSDASKIAQNRPEVKAKKSISSKISQNKPEVKMKKSESSKITWAKQELRERQSASQKIAQNRPEVKDDKSQKTKMFWKYPNYISKQMKAGNVQQNKLEKRCEVLFCNLFPNEYKFTGYGEVIIGGKCPDFINIDGQKKIIELYGDYWHQNDNPQDRIDLFAQYGYDTLVIWEHELKDVELLKTRLTNFHLRENLYSKHEKINIVG